MKIEVGSYEAKTKLPELLRGVQAGHCYTITLRGSAVANLVPIQADRCSDAMEAADAMLAFMQAPRSIGRLDLKALIDEGRE